MKRFFGYVWTISRYTQDGGMIANEGDSFVNLVTRDSGGKYHCHVHAFDPLDKVGHTLGACRNWQYDPVHFEGKDRDILRGDVSLGAGKSTHQHQIFMLYPYFSDEDELIGFILEDDQSHRSSTEILELLHEEFEGRSSNRRAKVAITHQGTYHSEN